jgi:uncharacterized protein YPO0396
MERARATWTDERLDDLAAKVDDGFGRLDEEIRDLRADLGRRIESSERELSRRIDAQGAEVSRRIDAMQRIMIQFGGGITPAVLATLVSVIATRA